MSDLIERAETVLREWADTGAGDTRTAYLVSELVTELKATRRQLERLQNYVTQHSDLCICDKAGLGHYDYVSCKVHHG